MPTKKQPAADAVDEQLARYRSMRDFGITAEPSGSTKPAQKSTLKKPATTQGLPFVIQKHAASHLHYDFRLGWNGVLKSWACAKGPSYVVKDRRLAVQVEDHPMEYGGFEGIIPAGQYGGGTVMVWDQGTWWPQPGHENVDAGLRDGSLKFVMSGTKMRGKWTLIRMNTKPGDKGGRWGNSSKPNWLLIKEHDEFEHPPEAPALVDDEPNSAVTGRSLEQIAAEEDHVWQSNKTAYLRDPSIKVPKGQAWHRTEKSANGATHTSLGQNPRKTVKESDKAPKARPTAPATKLTTALKSLPREAQPTFIKPQLATETTAPPEGPTWLHELKLDGYRIQARKSGARGTSVAKVQLLTRSGLDWTHRIPALAAAIAALPVDTVTLDGEAVVLASDGTTNFADLQASFQDGAKHPLTYFAFDLLHLNGHNPRALPLLERKALLASILPAGDDQPIRLSEHLETSGAEIFRQACELHAEGIVSKRADAPYRSARTADWLKSKCLREQEFVIAGFTLSSDGDDRIGSLLLGYYDRVPDTVIGARHPAAERSEGQASPRSARSSTDANTPELIYAGRTGTGFTQKLKRDLFTQLSALKLPKPAFKHVPTDARRGAVWVKPFLVAQVRFATWTAEDLVRQAAFLGLREDKQPTEVTREEPTVAPRPKSHKLSSALAQNHAAKAPRTDLKSRSSAHLTHPGKVLDAESGLTKQQLADYYAAIADRILPHIADRPLSLVRCPDGTKTPCFFQKHVNAMLPKGIGTVQVPDKKTGKLEPYITLSTPAQLMSLAQLGVLEIHPWGSKNNNLEHPDRLIFDLDPDESISWPTLCTAASEVRKRLKKLGLESFLKLTGGKGLHIVAPIEPTLTWSDLKSFANNFVLKMERSNPNLYLSKMSKAARKQKIYLDYLRNERGATAVAPYSPRARTGANVSLPLPWSALKELSRPAYPASEFPAWLKLSKADPWKSMESTLQQLDPQTLDVL